MAGVRFLGFDSDSSVIQPYEVKQTLRNGYDYPLSNHMTLSKCCGILLTRGMGLISMEMERGWKGEGKEDICR